jgi:hypothetical protein
MAAIGSFLSIPVISSFITQWHVSYESQPIESIFSEWDLFTPTPPISSPTPRLTVGELSEHVAGLMEQL